MSKTDNKMSQESNTIICLGNLYGFNKGGLSGDILDPSGICRCLTSAVGGAAGTYIIQTMEPNVIQIGNIFPEAGYANPHRGRVYHPGGIAPTITTCGGGNLEPKILMENKEDVMEPLISQHPLTHKHEKPVPKAIAPALRATDYKNPHCVYLPHKSVEVFPLNDQDGLCRTLKHQYQKNSAANFTQQNSFGATGVIEIRQQPLIVQKVGDWGRSNYSVHEYANTIPSNPMSDRGQMLIEPVCRNDRIGYKKMPNGNIRAFDTTAYDKRGISEMQITDPDNPAQTLTSAHVPNIIESENEIQSYMTQQETQYRIRKLTPRECFRLMDVDDDRIDLIQAATVTSKNGKVKPAVSKSQQYKMAGNSIVVSCLFHIFRRMFVDTEPTKPVQLSLFETLD